MELKAVAGLTDIHKVQVISHLKRSGHRFGLLINFNVRILKDGIKRIIVSGYPESLARLAPWRFVS